MSQVAVTSSGPRISKFVLLSLGLLVAVFLCMRPHLASAAACTAPSTDYGTVTNSVSVTSTGTYRVWTRMAAADTTNNTYLLEIDGSSCYTVGGSSVPTYSSAQDTANTRFASGSSNWISKTSAGTQVDVSLAAGAHTFKLIGNAPNVVIDRLVMTQDTSCVPTGTGDNCANPADVTPPTANLTAPAANAVISTNTTASVTATDDTLVSKVEFYVDGTLVSTDTTGSPAYTYTLNPTTIGVGAHSLYAIAYDSSNNTGQSQTINFTVPDTTAPTISAIAAGSLSQTSATITWTTNEAADSQIDYGTTTAYGSSTTLVTTKVTTHSVSLSGLTAGTTYHYHVKSRDAAGNLATSADASFTTQQPAGDTTKPVISLSAPVGGSTVSGGAVAVSAVATDNVGVVGVQFKLDGTNLGAEDTTVSTGNVYAVTWNTTAATNGSHTLTAVARDAAGNTQNATSITVTVNNVVALSADIDGNGTVDIRDYSAYRNLFIANYNQTGTSLGIVDFNGDHVVDIRDYSAFRTAFILQYGQ